jgi:hypothetical protein
MGTQTTLALAALIALVLPGDAQAQGDVSISINKHARLASDGAIIIEAHIACDPLQGVEDFQEVLAGAAQQKTGAEAEGGVDGLVICDGVGRTHTARLSPFTDEAFRRGPANASVSLLVCNVLGDDQICLQGAAQRRIIIRGSVAR